MAFLLPSSLSLSIVIPFLVVPSFIFFAISIPIFRRSRVNSRKANLRKKEIHLSTPEGEKSSFKLKAVKTIDSRRLLVKSRPGELIVDLE
jgi:hypothetical protein